MSEALINKYRPKSFDEVVGHASQLRALQNAIKKRSAQTFLFTGESGLGKTTLARLSAKALGCGSNILEVDAATNTGIDDTREVTSSLRYVPLEGESVGIIVDEFHALSKAAVQSLLKDIEEPPHWVYWFLCTTEPKRVLKTIQTRCFVVDLKPLTRDDLDPLLARVATAEKILDREEDDEILALCADQAEGSPRKALSNLAICAAAKNVKEARTLLSAADSPAEAVELARALLGGQPWPAIQKLLNGLRDANAESVRHVVRAYMTNVVLGAKKEVDAGRALEILDAFSQPFNSFDGISPVVMACGRLKLGGE